MIETNEKPIEHQIFGLALRVPGAISYFSEHLPSECVGVSQTGLHEFYVTLKEFHDRTGLDPVDPIAFRSWLETESDVYAALGGGAVVTVFLEELAELELTTPESVTAILKYKAIKRRQIESAQELHLLLSNKEQKSEQDRERISFLTNEIRSLETDIGYDPLANVVSGKDIASRADQLWELPDFLPTPFPSLNIAMGYTATGGFCKGAVHSILAASGKGKSTFCKVLMNHWVETGYTVLYVNYEEAIAHWERILFTQVTKKNVYLGGTLSPEDKEKATLQFQDKMNEWGDRFMVKHDPDTPYFDDLEKWLRDLIGHNDRLPDVVIVDTIQSMFMKGGAGKPRWGQFEEMMVRLEKLAKDLGAVFIITAQENSNRMKEGREVVQQSDIGGSLAIAQKSSVAIFITEKRLAGDDSENEFVMQLQIPKNRITGSVFTHQAPQVRYDDSTKSYTEYEPAPSHLYEANRSVLDDLLDEDVHK